MKSIFVFVVTAAISSTLMSANAATSRVSQKAKSSKQVETETKTALPKYGIIDLHGRQILPEKYFSIKEHTHSLLEIGSFDSDNPKLSPRNIQLWRVHDRTFVPTNVPKELRVTRILNGLFIVQNANKDHGDLGVFDKLGKKILDTKFRSIDYVGEDFIVVSNQAMYDFSGNKIGEFPNRAGLPKRYWNYFDDGEDDGLLGVRRIPIYTTNSNLKPKPPRWLKKPFDDFGFIDEKGNLVVSGFFFNSQGFSEGLALVNIGRGPAFIDTNGNKAFELDFGLATPFKNAVSIVTLNDGKVGAIDKSGHFLIRPNCVHVHPIGKNFFAAKHDTSGGGTWEIVDSSNSRVVVKLPAGTTWVSTIGEGMVPFVVGGEVDLDTGLVKPNSGALWGFIDSKTGKTLIKPSFSFAKSFRHGVAPASDCTVIGPNKMGLINRKGEWVIKPKYSDLTLGDRRIVITAVMPKNTFSTLDWKSETKTHLVDRRREFDALVQEFNLAGMKKSDFLDLVGLPGYPNDDPKDDVQFYVLESTGCINQRNGVEFEFNNDRVKRWRLVSGWQNATFGPWVE